jgi:hypothetical protein
MDVFLRAKRASVGRSRPGFDGFQGVKESGTAGCTERTPRIHDDAATKKGAKPETGTDVD